MDIQIHAIVTSSSVIHFETSHRFELLDVVVGDDVSVFQIEVGVERNSDQVLPEAR